MDIQLIAKQYIDAGWAVVPVVKGKKRAATRWNRKTYKPSDFDPTDNIAGKCGKPSGWRVDVDCDCPETIEAARLLLPNTGLVHGRPGKPDSHYWFISEDAKTSQFTDVKDAGGATSMLIEIRSTGSYTVLPPSEHPSGDVLGWAKERPAMTLEYASLYDAVAAVAIAALVARHYPGPGARHHFVGPFIGFLLQADIAAPLAIEILKTAAKIAGDADFEDRAKFARATVATFEGGGQVTGGPRLIDSLGEEVVAKLRAWMKMADLDSLVAMNEKHFFVRMGSKSVIGRTDDPAGVMFQQVRELYPEYANQSVQIGTDKDGEAKWAPLFETWLKSKTRRSYSSVVFAPPPRPHLETDYNLWEGFAIEPEQGECNLYLRHLKDVVCGGNEDYFAYLLKFCAFTIQQPGIPPGVAVVMRGQPGTGKGTVLTMFEQIFGRRHYAHLSRSEELVKWNALISGKVVVFADEAFFAGDREHHGALKRLITEPTITIARKHLEATEEANCMHLFMATNENWAIPAMQKERRFFVLDVDPKHIQDPAYFTPLYKEMAEGGVAAFLHMMQEWPVTLAEIRNAPKTDELRNQQDQSLSLNLKWVQECLDDGLIGAMPWAAGNLPTASIYEAYKIWVRDHTNRFLSKIEFSRQLMGYFTTAPKAKAVRIAGNLMRCYDLMPLDEAREAFDKQMGTETEWPDVLGTPPKAPF